MLFFLFACGDGGSSSGTASPVVPTLRTEASVTIVSPINDIVFVEVSTPIQLTFDRKIDLPKLKSAFKITNDVQGTWAFDQDTFTATFSPSAALDYSQTYIINLTASPGTETGNVLGSDYSWSFTTQNSPTDEPTKSIGVATLDLSVRNSASYTNTKALIQAMDIMGQPYIVNEQISEAITYPVIYASSYVSSSTLINTDKITLTEYVQNGGVLVVSSLSDPDLYSLFGISDQVRKNMRYELLWNKDISDSDLKYIDDPLEATSSLSSRNSTYLYTRSYTLSEATELAKYNDDTSAITKNAYGKG